MKLLEEAVMPNNTGRSFKVMKGQRMRIYAESIVDCVPFNLDDLKERFDQARTKAHSGKVFVSTGDKLYSKSARPMMAIVDDTYTGKHDLQYGMCSKVAYDGFWASIKAGDPFISKTFAFLNVKKREDLPGHGCWENIQDALKGYDVAPEDVPSPFNIFQSMDIVGPSGMLVWRLNEYRPEPGKPVYIDLRAEMNCLVALSACPELGMGKVPIKVQVFDE